MRVLLVNTNRMKPPVAPIGLDYLGDSLRAAGHQVRLLDLCFSQSLEADVDAAIAGFQPEVVGASVRNTDDCFFTSEPAGEGTGAKRAGAGFLLSSIMEAVDLIRRRTAAPIVMGGVGFSVMPEAVMDFCGIDYGIAGEGEVAFPLLLAAFSSGQGLDTVPGRGAVPGPDIPPGLDTVPGLLYRDRGKLRRNLTSDADLDSLPSRTRSLVDNRRYFREGGQAGFESKRGCPLGCVYCADPVSKGRRVRLRSPPLVVEELRALLSQGIDHFHTCDCEFNVPIHHAREVCAAIIEAGLAERIRWYAYCAPVPFDAEIALLMKRAGCAGIDFGADSGSAEVLRALGRAHGPDDLARTAARCRSAGIPFMYDLLLGGPGETRQTVRQTIELAKRVQADCVGVSTGVRVYDGTPLAGFVRAQGPIDSNPDLYGAKADNPGFLKPVFYVSPDLGGEMETFVRGLVKDDPRFFLPTSHEGVEGYNYNDNVALVRAIQQGARGAYWDILRRLRGGAARSSSTG